MDKVKDLQHYNILINDLKKLHKLKLSNCLFMKQDIVKLTKENTLFYEVIENGIFLIKIEKRRKYFYYLLESFDKLNASSINYDVMIELIDRKNVNRTSSHVEKWENVGFHKSSVNEEMMLIIQDKKDYIITESDYYEVDYALLKDIDVIINLWKENLDEVSMPLPDHDALKDLIVKKAIVCIMNPKKEVIGALQSNVQNGKCLLSHIVIDASYRRRGLAAKLVLYSVAKLPENKFYLWVNEKNMSAKRLYEKLGFKYSSKISIQMLKNKEKTI